LASFGKWYVSNPDLAERVVSNLEVNKKFDFMTLFRGMNGENFL